MHNENPRKVYENPELDVIRFVSEDILTASGTDDWSIGEIPLP